MILNRRHKKAELGRWLTNTYDPDRFDSRSHHIFFSSSDKKESDREWDAYVIHVEKHIIGPPKVSEKYTVEQLQKMHMVGVYAYPE